MKAHQETFGEVPNPSNLTRFIQSWVWTGDPRQIAVLYLVVITAIFLIGVLTAAMLRLEMIDGKGLVMTAEIFNRIFTMHGIIMMFLVLLPLIPGVLGSLLVPRMIGSDSFAFPRLQLLSWYCYLAGVLITLATMLRGGVDTTWTVAPPYASQTGSNVVGAALGIVFVAVSLLLMSVNYLASIHGLRQQGMKWTQLPVFVWTQYASSLILLLTAPILLLLMVLLVIERLTGAGLFDPALGGDPLLFKKLFWMFGRPSFYAIVLPAMGIITQVITDGGRRQVFGYRFVVISIFAIVVLGFLSAGSHLLVSAQSIYTSLLFSVSNFLIAVPFCLIIGNWIVSLFRASIRSSAPMVYAYGFVLLLTIGGLSGLTMAAAGANVHLHATVFVVAHFHYILAGGVLMAYLAGLHLWWGQLSGHQYPEGTARVAAIVLFLGLNLTFLPQFIVGMLGLPRRHFTFPVEFELYNIFSAAGLTILAFGYLLPALYFVWSLRFGPEVERAEALA
ncbi:MAG: cbb3-type cytochrome c oxidase subunit I [Acidobacteriota bacterium]|nr:MAG: cbb3-type cytochrome c oxidase subunit I [Acidobacteriota bacterium]